MPESGLSLSLDDLRAALGNYLGYGRGAVFGETAWNVPQANNIEDLLKSGLSQVYTPPELATGEPPHNWSFLRPFVNLTLPSGASQVDLPDDFGGFEGPIYILNPAAANRRWALPLTNEGMVQSMHASQPDTTGAPRIAAEKVLAGTTRISSTRSALYFWPVADGVYTVAAEYKHLPGVLTGSYPYPPGGAQHAELFKASVLACAELQLDDQRGPRWAEFLTKLSASVHVDRKRKGDWIGYNGDRSDSGCRVGRSQYNRYYDNPAVTYNGDAM